MIRTRRIWTERQRRAACSASIIRALIVTLLVALFTAGAAVAQTQPGRRVALVIGNATYTNGGVLDNPEADADAVAAKLTSLGFQVTSDKNLGQSGMRDLIGGFMSRVRDGDLVLIYYAGHGVEADGRDYMLPVDVKLETPAAVAFQGIPLDMLYSDRQTFGVIIVFDACRDNPFLRRVKGAVAGSHALSPPVGALVLFSASSGDVAEDGGVDAGGAARKNSVFAMAFNNALSMPDSSIQRIYQNILREVRSQTSNRQAPQRFGDLADDFTFNPSNRVYAAAAAPAPTAPAPAPTPQPVQVAAAEPPPNGAVLRSMPAQVSPADAAPAAMPTALPGPAGAAPPPPKEEAPAPAPTPAPQVVAALTTPPPSSAPAPAPAAATPVVAKPMPDMHFTIASLGENVMPPPPQLDPVPTLTLPARFCSVEEQIAYLKNVFKPTYDTAYRNNEIAIGYLTALNVLGQEYNGRQSGFVFRIKAQFEQFAPVAAKANETSNAVLSLDAQIRRIPVEACTGKG